MVEKVIRLRPNVVDFAHYQLSRNAAGRAPALVGRVCRHCGAALSEGEREEECSSAFNIEAPGLRGAPRKFYAD
jgi:hypothetical protein